MSSCTHGSYCGPKQDAAQTRSPVQVVGSAIAISLLTYGAIPLWAGVIVTAVASFVLLLLERVGVRWLEALFAVLIGVMGLSFGIMYILAGVPTVRVLEGGQLLILLCLDRLKVLFVVTTCVFRACWYEVPLRGFWKVTVALSGIADCRDTGRAIKTE
jgi:hypothetical protein